MAFWSTNNVEPTRQYRFTISDGTGVWWWAKSVEKPSFDIDSQEYKLINHKYKYPGVATWNDIKISIVDPNERAKVLFETLQASGYNPRADDAVDPEGIVKKSATDIFRVGGEIQIHQIDSNGKVIEQWKLNNAWIKSVTFGSLDYSNDELVTIDITVSYDWAELT